MGVYEQMLAGVAAYLRAVPGINDAIYPAPNSLSGSALAIVFGAEQHIDGGQEFMHTGRIRVGLYMASTDTPSAISAADALVEPIIDQFAANNPGYHLDGQIAPPAAIDRCTVSDVLSSQVLPYAGHDYFGAVVYLDYKYRRFAGGGFALP